MRFFAHIQRDRGEFLATFIVVSILVGGVTGCGLIEKTVRFRDDEKAVVFRVPALLHAECTEPLLALLSGMNGIRDVTPVPEKGELALTFNSRVVARQNIAYSIMRAGFDVDDSPGDPVARQKLPEPCRQR